MSDAVNPFAVRLRGQAFDAPDAKHPHGARELPPLRERNRGADSGVGSGAKPDSKALDGFPFPARFAQRRVDEGEGPRGTAAAFRGASSHAAGFDDGHAARLRGEFKGQNFHR